MAKKLALKKRKPAAQEGEEAGGEPKRKKRMWWEDELDGQRRSARDGPEENAAYFREEVRQLSSPRVEQAMYTGHAACTFRCLYACPGIYSDSFRKTCLRCSVPCLLVRVHRHGHLRILLARVSGAHVRSDRV